MTKKIVLQKVMTPITLKCRQAIVVSKKCVVSLSEVARIFLGVEFFLKAV